MKRTVLLTGATGYIGRRFEKILRTRPDIHLRLLVRNAKKFDQNLSPNADVIQGDTFCLPALQQALKGVDTAFYLIQPVEGDDGHGRHSLISAANFLRACLAQDVKKIIYLSRLETDKSGSAQESDHIAAGRILSSRPECIRTIWLRTGVIIGSGSHCFEVLLDLVQKLPVMIMPHWAKVQTRCIGTEDVLAYLNTALDATPDENVAVDIGHAQMTFLEMLRQTAQIMGFRRLIFSCFPSVFRLSSLLLALLTRVSCSRASALIQEVQSPVKNRNNPGNRYFSQVSSCRFPDMLRPALDDIHHDRILSRWCDSTPGIVCDVNTPVTADKKTFYDIRTVSISGIAPEQVFTVITSIGGKNGWFSYSFLWNVRGWLDKIAGGYGVNRGRRMVLELRIGDALDFWKVAELIPDKRLLLSAQLKLPGQGWLAFDIQEERLIQTAGFTPDGLMGYLYWYAVLPFHSLVFPGLCRQIVTRARKRQIAPAQQGDGSSS
ncbi:MAG: SDR family oxidoreductase [Desulfobulbus sp.]|nr:SDR family oxidoreductase [Desulfobulbus sp.]